MVLKIVFLQASPVVDEYVISSPRHKQRLSIAAGLERRVLRSVWRDALPNTSEEGRRNSQMALYLLLEDIAYALLPDKPTSAAEWHSFKNMKFTKV